jgi:hypothetical protein
MNVPATLGDAGVSNSDATYTGDVSTSPVSLDYFRSKVTEFQSTLQGLDVGYRAALNALDQGAGALDDETYAGLQDLVTEFQSKRWTMKATAEAINAGAAVINAAGGRMPKLNIPGTLGLLPAIPFAAIAAIGTAAALTVWGNTWLKGLNDRLKTAQLLDAQSTPEARAALAVSIAQSDAAIATAEASGFSTLAPMLKWAAISVGAWMLWKAWNGRKKGGD